MRVEIHWHPSASVRPRDCAPELIVGPPNPNFTTQLCPVCSAACRMEIAHSGPLCEEGKPVFSMEVEL